MKQILTLFTICIVFTLSAQTVQKGVVKEYNEKAQKTPLAGVELNVRAANSEVSDNAGNFTLQFLTLKPGEKVNVRRIEKLGYEVFNKEAIEQWNLNPKTPFVIVMCRSDKFKKIRDNYEKVSSESYARQLKKEEAALLKLKEQGKLKEAEYQKQLFELRENYEKQLDNLENYVDRFSRIDLSEISEQEQEIIALVQEGRIEDAIAKYEDHNYIEQYIKEVNDIKEISVAIDQLSEVKQSKIESRDSLRAAVQRQIETLRLAGGKDNFDKVLGIYEEVIKAGESNIEFIRQYMEMLNEYHLFERSINLYHDILSKREYKGLEESIILRNVGNAYCNMQKLDEAIEIYNKSLEVLQEESINKEEIEDTRLRVFNNIGLAFSRKGEYEKALNYLTIRPQKIETEEESLQEIRRLSNLANIYRIQGDLNIVDSIYNAAIDICNRVDPKDNRIKDDLLLGYSVIIQGKGHVSSLLGDFDKAEEYYEKAIHPLKEGYTRNPRKFASSIAIFYYNFGLLYSKKKNTYEKAIPLFKESISIYETILNETFVQKLFDNYAEVIANLARAYDNIGDKESIIYLCNEAEKMLDCCKDFPSKGSVLVNSIGLIYGDMKDYEKSLSYYNKGLSNLLVMYDEYPGIYSAELARLYCNMATNLCRIGQFEKAKDYFSKSANLFLSKSDQDQSYKQGYIEVIRRAYLFLCTSSEIREGLKYLRILQKLEPDNLKYFEHEIIFLIEIDEVEEAKDAFSILLNTHPEYPKDSKLYKMFVGDSETNDQ